MTDRAAEARMPEPHGLYFCTVGHVRLRPFRHAFRYRVFSLLLDLDRLDRLPRFLSHNRFNLFGFHDRDHGPRDGRPLRPWVESELAGRGIDLEGGSIRVLCFPRVLGYVFNPLSIFYCHGPDGTLRAIVHEVKNTFGDQHCYVCPVTEAVAESGTLLHQSHAKEFHVSPFFGMEGTYRFRLTLPGSMLSVHITLANGDGDLLTATQTGRRVPLTAANLVRAFITHPLVTLKVIGGIHWEAFRLWRKGAVFHRRPDPPVRLSGGVGLADRRERTTFTGATAE